MHFFRTKSVPFEEYQRVRRELVNWETRHRHYQQVIIGTKPPQPFAVKLDRALSPLLLDTLPTPNPVLSPPAPIHPTTMGEEAAVPLSHESENPQESRTSPCKEPCENPTKSSENSPRPPSPGQSPKVDGDYSVSSVLSDYQEEFDEEEPLPKLDLSQVGESSTDSSEIF
ncbi:hypothetical protein Ciccas_006495 [Cichlidogyrus casuarinus]|uniref:Uncharacterized protein n=1 Tax=Cichlidogyrus casuarinus TaxID=1844966 RepID=A0ABD2Q6L9_9PLAT